MLSVQKKLNHLHHSPAFKSLAKRLLRQIRQTVNEEHDFSFAQTMPTSKTAVFSGSWFSRPYGKGTTSSCVLNVIQWMQVKLTNQCSGITRGSRSLHEYFYEGFKIRPS